MTFEERASEQSKAAMPSATAYMQSILFNILVKQKRLGGQFQNCFLFLITLVWEKSISYFLSMTGMIIGVV